MEAESLIGQTLAVFRLDAVLAQGDMSVFYEAWDPIQERVVSLKVLKTREEVKSPGLLIDPSNFIQKARLLATWDNEHIRKVYYAGEQDGILFAAMQPVHGQTLTERLAEVAQSGEKMSVFRVLQYGRAIAEALDYAHFRGVAHGDLRPENIIILPDGNVLLDGFLKAHKVIQPTPFTAPEQYTHPERTSSEADLYSFGAVLYTLLTGQPPYLERPPIVGRDQTIPLPPPADELNPKLNDKVDVMLLRALMYDQHERYHTGAETIEALQSSLSGGSLPFEIPPPPIPPIDASPLFDFQVQSAQTSTGSKIRPGKTVPTIDRNWVIVGIGFLGLIIVSIVIFIAFIQTNRSTLPPILISEITPSVTPSPVARQVVPPGEMVVSVPVTSTFSPEPTIELPVETASPSSLLSLVSSPTQTDLQSSPALTIVSPTLMTTLTSTPIYYNGRHFILFYNDSSFYMYQSESYESGIIEPVSFERLDQAGNPVNRFLGVNFSIYHPKTSLGYCMRIEIQDAQDYLRPSQCQGYLVTRWPLPGSDLIFWTNKEGSAQFRVNWYRTEVARCEIAAGVCDVYLP